MLDEALRHPRPAPAAFEAEAEVDSGSAGRRPASQPGAVRSAGRAGDAVRPWRWRGWWLGVLILAAFAALGAGTLLVRALAHTHHVDAAWRSTGGERLELIASNEPALEALRGQRLLQLVDTDARSLEIDTLALHPSARWLVADERRAEHAAVHAALARLLQREQITLVFDNQQRVTVPVRERGYAGLAPMFWLLSAFAFALYLVGVTVVLARPNPRNVLYLLMAVCQAASLVFIAIESIFDLGTSGAYVGWERLLRPGLDAVTAAALLTAIGLYPRRLPGAGVIAAAAWLGAAAWIAWRAGPPPAHAWWWDQAGVALAGVAATALLSWSYRIEPHPFAIVLRRSAAVTTGTWLLLTLATAAAQGRPGIEYALALAGPLVWTVYVAALLMLLPLLSNSPRVMRLFGMLAAIGTVTTALHLVFAVVFALGPLLSLTLSLLVSLAVYAGARQWIVDQPLGSSMLSTERMFEQLYRIARAVEAAPERMPVLLSGLLREIFDPIAATLQPGRRGSAARVTNDGSTLLVPVPPLARAEPAADVTLELRFARRGRRLFTADDARLAGRIVEQLQRAVAHDEAVEEGRSEERLRLAQDLHDDIGARLLTLMYKAPSPEMEEYVRHTLQDLKTLTRGLAASSHRLSHASAEWKSDLGQRLTAAHVALRWSCHYSEDIALNVVQWSALTRILRELVSNVIAHAQARSVEVDIHLSDDRLDLSVSDDGVGRAPETWPQGLGLGGVQKRVKQLDGDVAWRELAPHGIGCEVKVRGLAPAPAASA